MRASAAVSVAVDKGSPLSLVPKMPQISSRTNARLNRKFLSLASCILPQFEQRFSPYSRAEHCLQVCVSIYSPFVSVLRLGKEVMGVVSHNTSLESGQIGDKVEVLGVVTYYYGRGETNWI